ncbi:MAG: helix-turn-helix domain-containing protein [Tepidiformaceae bacterium]
MNEERGTLTIGEAAQRLGVGKAAAYQAAREDRLPVPVIRVGRRILVSRAALEAVLAAGVDAGERARDARG